MCFVDIYVIDLSFFNLTFPFFKPANDETLTGSKSDQIRKICITFFYYLYTFNYYIRSCLGTPPKHRKKIGETQTTKRNSTIERYWTKRCVVTGA